jgi:uncharacterized spore protein YtfJ
MTTAETHNGSALADDLVQRIGKAVGESARATAIFGEAVEREGVTVIPVAKSRFGFGGGAGSAPGKGETERESDGEASGEASGGGGGGGGAVIPVGYIELRDGEARFKRIYNATDLLPLLLGAALGAMVLGRLLRR